MRITGKAKLAGVMGWPVGHTRSPQLHGYWLDKYRVDGAYLPLAVEPGHLADALRALPKLGFTGCNLTVPHKVAAMPLVDEVDGTARRIGAVNTIVVAKAGRLVASNTDAYGFVENLRVGAPGWHAGSGPAVVLGAGGAARALLVALVDAGAPEIRLVNRTLSRAEDLAQDLDGPIVPVPWQDRTAALAGATLLAQSTTLGMTGQPALDLALDELPTQAVVNDIVYVPLETPLLAAARRRGNTVVDGLGMLLHQARPGFAAWFGHQPQVTEDLRRVVLAG